VEGKRKVSETSPKAAERFAVEMVVFVYEERFFVGDMRS